MLKAIMVSALEAAMQYDETLSNFAFKFNLRRYIEGRGGSPQRKGACKGANTGRAWQNIARRVSGCSWTQ
jgi:hypothetical protein